MCFVQLTRVAYLYNKRNNIKSKCNESLQFVQYRKWQPIAEKRDEWEELCIFLAKQGNAFVEILRHA